MSGCNTIPIDTERYGNLTMGNWWLILFTPCPNTLQNTKHYKFRELKTLHIALRMAKNKHRDRYNYGVLYRGEDGEVYMKLNLQIRFKK